MRKSETDSKSVREWISKHERKGKKTSEQVNGSVDE